MPIQNRKKEMSRITYDRKKTDEAALALLCLSVKHEGGIFHANKALDAQVLRRLQLHGYLYDPKATGGDLVLTETGMKKAFELFERLFKPTKPHFDEAQLPRLSPQKATRS